MCHYCGFETAPFQKCPALHAARDALSGARHREAAGRDRGEVPRLASCQRMDSDTMSKPGSHQRVLDAFRDGLDPHPRSARR